MLPRQKLGLVIVLGSLAGGLLLGRLEPMAGDAAALGRWLDELANDPKTPYVLMAALAATGGIVFPAAPFVASLGTLYGAGGGIYVAIGSSVGVVLGWVLGRMVGAPDLEHIEHRRFRQVIELAERHGLASAFLIRFVPGLPFAMQNVFIGSLGVGLVAFYVGSMAGIAFTQSAMMAVGYLGGQLLDRAAGAIRYAGYLQAAGVAVGAAMVVIPWFTGRGRKERA